jgi:16S rRNA A1518/A1519 N6-dimethyltransferase RsmA/KsgA/DIM1 with predicted DNA glycosylase/AP lyase activity
MRREQHDAEEAAVERPLSLHEQRLNAVLDALKESGAQRVLDLGCGEGRLLQLLLKQKQFAQIVGLDVSHRALEIARDRLRFERLAPMQQQRITLMQGSLIYRDARLHGSMRRLWWKSLSTLTRRGLVLSNVSCLNRAAGNGYRYHAQRRVQREVGHASGGHDAPQRSPL